MPLKRLDELYTSIGYNKHGKTVLYRSLIEHMARGDARFEKAEGDEGLVMAVFTLPSFNVVFKVIKDTFGLLEPGIPARHVLDQAPVQYRLPVFVVANGQCTAHPAA